MRLQYSANSEINREFQKLTLLVLCADVLDVTTAVTISVYLVLLGLNALNGCIFSISADGEYIHGVLYLLVYIVPYYFIGCSAYVLLYHIRKFQAWQKASIILYLILAFIGPVFQLIFFPDVLLGLFSVAMALMMILFTMETPDYQKLMQTIKELRETKEAAEKAEKEAQEANQAKTDFLANISHEVRTPINVILGYNEMIMRETKESQTTEYAINVQAAH